MTEADKEQYLKRGPLVVLGVLRDLEKYRVPVIVSSRRGQFISRLLFVDQEKFFIDYGSDNAGNQVALEAQELHLFAEMQGAKVEFRVNGFTATEFEGLPAFSAPLPELLWKIQRREFFRVSAPLEPVFFCYTRWPDGSAARFRLQDLSLGGFGVLMEGALPEKLGVGNTLKNLRIELAQYGQFEVDAQLLSVGERTSLNSKNETVVTPRLNFRFASLNAGQERDLQQVIFSLERLAREKATRFQ